jgi:hypothetical protein
MAEGSSKRTKTVPHNLTPGEWRLVALLGAHLKGVHLTFGEGSNPHVHLHVHLDKGNSMSEVIQNMDQSSGPTGAKSLGEKSVATNTGPVSQQIVSAGVSEELLMLIAKLSCKLESLQVSNRIPLEEAASNLTIAASSLKSGPAGIPEAKSRWTKAKTWVTSAIGAGLFAVTEAEDVKQIVERLTDLLK